MSIAMRCIDTPQEFKNSLVALCDCDNFFVSCERLRNPELKTRPVVVLSSNDGCIVSRSDEVKAMGIKMGEPYFKVKYLMQKKGVTVISGDHKLYKSVSRRVMQLLSSLTDKLAVYSIDEAFINFPMNIVGDPCIYGAKIREAILNQIGVPVSIGIAGTRTLAKLAADMAKKHKKECLPVFYIHDEECRLSVLEASPVADVWGIGRKSALLMERCGVRSAADLTRKDIEWIRKKLSIRGVMIVLELKGQPCNSMISRNQAPKSIQVSRSFGQPLFSMEELEKPLIEHVISAGYQLRREGMATGYLNVYIRSGVRWEERDHMSGGVVFNPSAASDHELIGGAVSALRKIYIHGRIYTKAGVVLTNLTDARYRQRCLFDDCAEGSSSNKIELLSGVLDMINNRFGRGTIYPAVLAAKDKKWLPKEDYRA